MLHELAHLLLQGTVITDSFLAFNGFGLTNCLGGSLSGDESSPTVIGAVEFGGFFFAGASGFATGALGGGNTARQERQADLEGALFRLHLDVYIH